MATRVVAQWNFDSAAHGWRPLHNVACEYDDGRLVVRMTGEDPYLMSAPFQVGGSERVAGPLRVRIHAKYQGSGHGRIYWTSDKVPQTNEGMAVAWSLIADNEWHTYDVVLPSQNIVTRIRFDPGDGVGSMEIDEVQVLHDVLHPLGWAVLTSSADEVRVALRNHGKTPLTVEHAAESTTLDTGEKHVVVFQPQESRAFQSVPLTFRFPRDERLPAIEHFVSVHDPQVPDMTWPAVGDTEVSLRVSPDGRGARVWRGRTLLAVVHPLLTEDGQPVTAPVRQDEDALVVVSPQETRLMLKMTHGVMAFHVAAKAPVEGPVVRVLGDLEQGLLAGVEYLGRRERSSSTLDLMTPEHVRFRPDRRWLTMPLMGFVTDGCSAMMRWQDMRNQPIFATPNFIDGTAEHRMSLVGQEIAGAIDWQPGWPERRLADAVLAHVRHAGFPEIPQPPRSPDEQFRLCLDALEGPLRGNGGWGHCVGPRWPQRPYAGHASTIWRLTGKMPAVPELVRGGTHIANDAAYLASSRAEDWLRNLDGAARHALRQQHPDGTFRYTGEYRRGHFEDTASGLCAAQARPLLDYAWYTGDPDARQAGLRALAAMRRFRTPRGAQTWEVPLHTPDILASAHLVHDYVRGYQITEDPSYLEDARRWAVTGIPFVYQWGDRPIMRYATTPVLGATNWTAPNWIGLPVQWCGLSYAYALLDLAEYDDTLPWRTLARGILVAAEQMQYPDGPSRGCLPDGFQLRHQQRLPADINPCVLVALRLRLAGELDNVAVAVDGDARVTAPFPVRLSDGQALVDARAGESYQVVINGQDVITVQSQGQDRIAIGGPCE